MNLTQARLTRVHTVEGWQFLARPNPDGAAWLLCTGHSVRAEVTADSTVYELRRGDTLIDYFDGRVVLRFKNNDTITCEVDGSVKNHRSDGSLRSELTADGRSLEYWVDGVRQAHQHWATVIVYQG